jgi:hypothetical protein
MVLRRLDRKPGLDGATCRGMQWPDGSVSENVAPGTGSDGRELTDEELDARVSASPSAPSSHPLGAVSIVRHSEEARSSA